MLRSLYSAVSGMKAHQTKLDVIGNNIANVNTYGFKSSRARFQDVFYQTLQSAAGGDNNKGGTNASQVGYGSQLGGIDLDMSRSALQSTGRPMDVAITGEGFFQVMDADGNIFYTRAGNLMLDSNSGNLVDSNGYTVLGVSGDPLGKAPSSDKIHLNIPTKSSGLASKTLNINGTQFTITSEKATTDANVSITFKAEDNLPSGSDIVVNSSDINDSSITVHVNKNAIFTSLSDFNSKMNSAITRGCGGKAHPGGNFTITATPAENVFQKPLTGAELLGDHFGINEGTFEFATSTDAADGIFGGLKFSGMSTSPAFDAAGPVDFKSELKPGTGGKMAWVVTATVGGREFVGEINENTTTAGKMWLKEAGTGQYIEMSHPGYTAITSSFNGGSGNTAQSFHNVTMPAAAGTGFFNKSMSLKDYGTSGINPGDNIKYSAVKIPASAGNKAKWHVTAVSGGKTYSGDISEGDAAGDLELTEEGGAALTIDHKGYSDINTAFLNADEADKTYASFIPKDNAGTITAATQSNDVGLGSGTFTLEKGTEGGAISLSGASIAILGNGIIEATHPDKGKIQIGRIDLVTFENPYGLEENGNSYFRATSNSGEAKACQAGEDGTGALKTSSLEMSNVDISTEFSDMIVTQRGFQANSRIITVSDSILEELVNLKR